MMTDRRAQPKAPRDKHGTYTEGYHSLRDPIHPHLVLQTEVLKLQLSFPILTSCKYSGDADTLSTQSSMETLKPDSLQILES